jgi:hypothetical protein
VSIAKLHARLADPAPAFECRCVDRTSLLVPLRHQLGAPASKKQLDGLAAYLEGAAPGLLDLYREIDGMLLYADESFETAGIALPTIRELPDLQDLFQVSLATLDDGGDMESAVVLGGAQGTGNFLIVPVEGARRGRILLFDHETSAAEPFAKDAAEMLHRFVDDPVAAVRALGDVRYGALQGSPQRYFADRRASGVADGPVRATKGRPHDR